MIFCAYFFNKNHPKSTLVDKKDSTSPIYFLKLPHFVVLLNCKRGLGKHTYFSKWFFSHARHATDRVPHWNSTSIFGNF